VQARERKPSHRTVSTLSIGVFFEVAHMCLLSFTRATPELRLPPLVWPCGNSKVRADPERQESRAPRLPRPAGQRTRPRARRRKRPQRRRGRRRLRRRRRTLLRAAAATGVVFGVVVAAPAQPGQSIAQGEARQSRRRSRCRRGRSPRWGREGAQVAFPFFLLSLSRTCFGEWHSF